MSTSARTAATSPEGSDLSGRTLDGFLLIRKLGQGGMGQVYLAEQVSLMRKVAIKLLRPEMASSPEALTRFKHEAHAVAQATHANIVQVYATGEADGLTYMALEYVEGRNLKEFISKKGPPDLLVVISIMRQVGSALQRAAELGIVHRDIKPENILLTRKGEVKVADFGLSRCLQGDQPALHLTQSGVTMGTPLYMSPEQVEGKPVDPRTDIYAFGVTCYYMLSGQQPFRGDSAFEVALAHVQKEPKPLASLRPDLPEMLCAIIHKMMAKNPDQRYQSARDLLRDILRLRESLGAGPATLHPATVVSEETSSPTTGPRGATTRMFQPANRRIGLVLAVAGSMLVVAGLGAGAAWIQQRSARSTSAGVKPADAGTVETISLPNKREQALRELVRQDLNPGGKPADRASGFGLCMDLGLFYLEENRLNDAEKLFARLASFKEPSSYHLLGKLGLGIVLALQNHPKESNDLFREVFPPVGSKAKKGEALPGLPRFKEVMTALKPVMESPRWGYWIARARWYNQVNGLPEAVVPRFLVNRYTLPPGKQEIKK